MHLAVQAARLGMDWRPVLGLTPADAGTLLEVAIARVVVGNHIGERNAEIAEQEAEIERQNKAAS